MPCEVGFLKRKWIVMTLVVVFLAFYTFYGLPPTSANHAPAYLAYRQRRKGE